MNTLTILGVAALILWLIPSPISRFARYRVYIENRRLSEHLHTKMEIDAKGLAQLKQENEQLRRENENLRISFKILQNKPKRDELRLLYIYDRAVDIMTARVPGFAPVWQVTLKDAENEMREIDKGIRAFARRVFKPSSAKMLSSQGAHLLNNQSAQD